MTLCLLRFRTVVGLFVVTTLAVGCLPPDPPHRSSRPPITTNSSRPPPTFVQPPPGEPPSYSVRINRVSPNWDEKMQRFWLVLTNTGAQKAKVSAIVYGRNESLSPPRRGLSPPTASELWFQLAGSRDGRITSYDIEHSWRSDRFVTLKLGKLARTWDAELEPGQSKEIEAFHDLEDVSPHPDLAFKGKKLAKTGYNEYQVWLFTSDGYCFARREFKVDGSTATQIGGDPQPKIPPTKPDTKPTTKPDAKPETSLLSPQTEAAGLLLLANHYLDKNQPEKAREQLEKIVAKFPDTDAAKTAGKLLKTMK